MNKIIWRFIAPFFCALFLFGFASSAKAGFEPREWAYAPPLINWNPSPAAVCDGIRALYAGNYGADYTWEVNRIELPYCYVWGFRISTQEMEQKKGELMQSRIASCPVNSTLQGNECVCDAGTVQEGGQCKKKSDPQCVAGTVLINGECVEDPKLSCKDYTGKDAGIWTVTQDKPSLGFKQVCDTITYPGKSCMLKGEADFCGEGSDGKHYCSFSSKYTGGKCTASPTASPEVGPGTDPDLGPGGDNNKDTVGKCPGTVNGVTVYVKCGNSVSKTDVETVSGDPPKTEKTTETVKCEGEVCTKTTITTSTVNGTTTISGSSTTSGKKDIVCKGSETATCTGNVSGGGGGDGDGSSFGGSCKAGFTCDGDAATCAIAKAANESKCRLFDLTDASDTAKLNVGLALASGTDTSVVDPKTTAGGAKTFSMSMLQDAGNPYGDTCPANITFMVAGRSVAIPLADNCGALRMLGLAFWASTIFATAVFVLKGQG